jgi:putative ABC transport system substrate-binding protein
VSTIKNLTIVVADTPSTQSQVQDADADAHTNGVGLDVMRVADAADLDSAFAAIQGDGILFTVDPFFESRANDIVVVAARRRLPTMCYIREVVEVGGLVSYGASIGDAYRQPGLYTGRILAGAKPSALPVVLSTKFEFVLNRKTAGALGLEVPDKLLAIADEVIE